MFLKFLLASIPSHFYISFGVLLELGLKPIVVLKLHILKSLLSPIMANYLSFRYFILEGIILDAEF